MDDKITLIRQAANLRDKRKYAEAAKIYEKALEMFGPDPDLIFGLARLEYTVSLGGEIKEISHLNNALQWIERAISLKPDEPTYYFALSFMLEFNPGAPNYAAAIKALRRAVEIEPCYISALMSLSRLFGVPGSDVSLGEAISCCEKAVRVEPTKTGWTILARLYGYASREADKERALVNSIQEMRETLGVFYSSS